MARVLVQVLRSTVRSSGLMPAPDARSSGCDPEILAGSASGTLKLSGKDFQEEARTAGQAGKSLFKAVLQFEQHKVKLQMYTDETGPHAPH